MTIYAIIKESLSKSPNNVVLSTEYRHIPKFKMTDSKCLQEMSKVAHNLNSLLIEKHVKMSFECEGIKLEKLKEHWSTIQSNLPSELSAKLEYHLELSLANKNEANIMDLYDFVGHCCEYMPANFQEYIAYVMIATSIELLNVPSSFRAEKSRLFAHAFGVYTEPWSHDQDKVSTLKFGRIYPVEIKCYIHSS